MIRKIQFARMSIGNENTIRIPATQSIMSRIVEASSPSPTVSPDGIGCFIRFPEKNRKSERDAQIEGQQQAMLRGFEAASEN